MANILSKGNENTICVEEIGRSAGSASTVEDQTFLGGYSGH
jgi:hypothetical protein